MSRKQNKVLSGDILTDLWSGKTYCGGEIRCEPSTTA